MRRDSWWELLFAPGEGLEEFSILTKANPIGEKVKNQDRYTSIIWTAFGLYIAFEGYRLELGAFYDPKPGFFVFWAGIILSSLSMALLLQTFFSPKEEDRILWKGVRWSKGVRLMASLFVYALVFPWLGFISSSLLLLLFLFKGLQPMSWQVALPLSFITITLFYLLFEVFLGFHFPGIF
jgi:putative tricarboxylic transport membrane protein